MQMSRKKTKQIIKKLLRAHAKDDVRPRDTDSLYMDLGYDSLRLSILFGAMEKEFDRALPLNEWLRDAIEPVSLTVDSLTDYVHRALIDESRE